MKKNISYKKLLLVVLIVITCLYALSWVVYGLGYANAKRSIRNHYGETTKVKDCSGGANSYEYMVDSNEFFSHNYTGAIPAAMRPFLSFNDYSFVYYYKTDGTTKVARGSTNAFGQLKEASNETWEYRCLLL